MLHTRPDPQNVILFGNDALVSEILPFVERANLTVNNIVSIDYFASTKSDVLTKLSNVLSKSRCTTLSFSEYEQQFSTLKDIPMIVADDGTGQFFKSYIEILTTRLISPPALLHPLVLFDYLPLKFRQKVKIFGFPGAGNVLLQVLCEKILKAHCSSLPHDIYMENKDDYIDSTIFNRLFSSYYNILFDTLQSGIKPFLDGGTSYFQFSGGQYADFFTMLNPNEFVVVRHLILKLYINASVHGSHEKGDRRFFDNLRRMNVKIFAALRNPLDILVSFTMKGGISQFVEIGGGLKTGDIPNYREVIARIQIENDIRFSCMANIIKNYYTDCLKSTRPEERFYYEDAIDNPDQFVFSVASALGVELESNKIKEIASIIGRSPVHPSNIHHFSKPLGGNRRMVGKWQEFMSPDRLEILKGIGYDELLEEMGFGKLRMDLARQERGGLIRELGAEVYRSLDQKCTENTKYQTYIPMLQAYSHEEMVANSGLGTDLKTLEVNGLLIIGTRAEWVEKTGRMLSDKTTRAIVGALNSDRLVRDSSSR